MCIVKFFLSLLFFSVPSEPVDFNVNVESNTSVNLVWKAPQYPNGVIAKYRVYYNETMAEHGETYETTEETQYSEETKETQYSVKKLTPYTKYSFWVRAETSAGLGNSSGPISNITKEGGNLS
jgi:hypothetical protein